MRESRLFLFKSQTFTLLTSPSSKDKHTQIKRPHTYTEGDHTDNHTKSFISAYMHIYVCVCDLKHT